MPLWRMILTATNLVSFRLGGAGIGLVTQIVLARLLSKDDVGIVLMTMSAAALISLVMTAGYPALSITSLARFYALGSRSLVAAFHTAAWRDTFRISALMIVFVVSLIVFTPFNPGLNTALIFGTLIGPFSSLIRMTSATANSQRRFSLSYIADYLFRPGLLLAYLLLAFAFGLRHDLTTVLIMIIVITATVAIGQAIVLGEEATPTWRRRPAHRFGKLLRYRALSLVIVAAVTIAFADVVTIIGGLFLPPDNVAAFGIAIRLAALAGFVTQSTQQMMLPDLAKALVKGQRDAVQTLLLRVNLLSVAAILVCVFICIFFGPLILGIFGPEYALAHWPLVLFMVSQLFRAAAGMNQHLLAIDGFQAHTASSCAFAVVVLVLGAALLAPSYGIMGMACAVLVSDFVWAGLLGVQAQRYTAFRGDILAVAQFRRGAP
jgi:O-antigen/teichoic acid export membrane protein